MSDVASRPGSPAGLVLGPLLRYVGDTTATVWIEADRPSTVEVLGHAERTFQVCGHHYALVLVQGLEPATRTRYDVQLDGERVWPPDDGRPAPTIRTREGERHCRLVFGSCRVAAPAEPPYTLLPSEHPEGLGIDALWAYAKELQDGRAEWPDGLVLLGDQMYVDHVSPDTAAFIRSRRDVSQPPGLNVADFEEYTQLYRESWSEPEIRWLLSTVPTTMIFDDHEVIDDWNISAAWLKDIRARPWWDDRVTAAFMAYWIYQHLGNLSPPELTTEAMLALVRSDEDAGPRLRAFARHCDRESAASRWAYHRDFGRSRLVVIDSRAARVLVDGERHMVDPEEWEWIAAKTTGSFDHLVIATTLPVFLPPGIHFLEAWNEAMCGGRWGRVAAWVGERIRRACDLEHWAAFEDSFDQLVALLREVSAGSAGTPPATVTILGGDVHTTYAARVDLGDEGGSSSVYQLVCSPFRNPMGTRRRRVVHAAGGPVAARIFAGLARACGVSRPTVSWEYLSPRTYDNTIGELCLDRRSASVRLRRSKTTSESGPWLKGVVDHQLSVDAKSEGRSSSSR